MGMMSRLEKSGVINKRYRVIEIKNKSKESRYFIVDYFNPRKTYNYISGIALLKNSFESWEINKEDLQNIKIQQTGEVLPEVKLHKGSYTYTEKNREKTEKGSLKYKLWSPGSKNDFNYAYWIIGPITLPVLERISPNIQITGIMSWILFVLLLAMVVKFISSFVRQCPDIDTVTYKKIVIKQKHDSGKIMRAGLGALFLQLLFTYALISVIFLNFDIIAYIAFSFLVGVFSILKIFGNISNEADIEIIEF